MRTQFLVSGLFQFPQKHFENGRMNRLIKLHACQSVFHPADLAFDRLQGLQLDPDPFPDDRPINELHGTAILREVEDANAKVREAGTANDDLGIERDPC